MKAYVIKNKEGKYLRGIDIISYKPDFCEDIIDAMPFEKDELKRLEFSKDCTIIPITICEGDLEEENRVMKKALELACETIKELVGKPAYICGGAIAERLGIPMMPEVKDADYFIQQAKESKKDGL